MHSVLSVAPACALCGGSEISAEGTLKTAELVALWKRIYSMDISRFLTVNEIRWFDCARCGLRSFRPPLAGDDTFYAELMRHPWYYLTDKVEYDVAAGFVAPNSRVIDVGCGIGAFSSFVNECGGSFTGLEMNSDAVRTAVAAGRNVRAESAAAHLFHHAEEYDLVTSFQVLEHVPEPRSFFGDLVGLSRPGGLVLVSVPSADSYLKKLTNGLLNLPPHHVTWWRDRTLKELAVSFDLDLVAIIPETPSPTHFRALLSANAVALLNRCLFRHPGLIDGTLTGRIVTGLASRAAAILARPLSFARGRHRGHTVTGVFRRPSPPKCLEKGSPI